MKPISLMVLAGAVLAAGPACAQRAEAPGPHTIVLDTVPTNTQIHWVTLEKENGLWTGRNPYYANFQIGANSFEGLAIPYLKNDGYWVAVARFFLPQGAINPTLTISNIEVDDRGVLALNNQYLTSVGYDGSKGTLGDMTFTDHGPNLPHTFTLFSGAVSLTFTSGFKPGANILRMIVNNTGDGILGTQVVPDLGNQTEFGLTGTITYTMP